MQKTEFFSWRRENLPQPISPLSKGAAASSLTLSVGVLTGASCEEFLSKMAATDDDLVTLATPHVPKCRLR